MTEPVNDATKDAQPKERVVLQIIITIDGEMRVQGPLLGDEVAALGMLQKAQHMISELHRPKVVKPVGNFLQGLRQNGVGK